MVLNPLTATGNEWCCATGYIGGNMSVRREGAYYLHTISSYYLQKYMPKMQKFS